MSLFQSQLAIAFGGGRDIGRAISIELARSGAKVAFSYHNGTADETISAISRAGVTAWARQVDALDTAAVRQFAKWASQQAGARPSAY